MQADRGLALPMDVDDVLEIPDGAAGAHIRTRVAKDGTPQRGGHGGHDDEDCHGDPFQVRDSHGFRERMTAT